MSNPFFNYKELPRFDELTPSLAKDALITLIETTKDKFQNLEKEYIPTWQGLMRPLYELGQPIEFAWGLVGHELSVMNSDAWREIYTELQPQIVEFYLNMGQSEKFYQGMKNISEGKEWDKLSNAQQRVLKKSLQNAELSGVALTGEKKKKFNEISNELASLQTTFNNNVLDSKKQFSILITKQKNIAGLPDSFLESSAQAAQRAGHKEATAKSGPWLVSLEYPSYIPFMKYSKIRELREKLYRAMITVASEGEYDNRDIVNKILLLRQEKANLLEIKNYAEISLLSKMAPSVEAVNEFTNQLIEKSKPFAEKELAVLQQYADKCQGEHIPLKQWDITYWAEKQRQELYDYTEEELRPYFQLPKIMQELFNLSHKLFGITVEKADGKTPVWHKDVQYFVIKDENQKQIASLYLDLFSRPANKRGGAWMSPACGRDLAPNGTLTLPYAYIVCNQTLPVGDKPALMTFNEMTTLFHEFGHALQHTLTTVDEPEAAGIANVEWDAVELASQFMENWCYHKNTLLSMSEHVETTEQLPIELYDKIIAAKQYRAGSMVLRQCCMGLIDMKLHELDFTKETVNIQEYAQNIETQILVMPPIPENRFLCSFSHIFAGGYCAGYYSYKWAELLSADAFSAFEEVDMTNEEELAKVGKRYRDTILAMGGSKHPMELFKEFRGRKPSIEPLLKSYGLN